MSRIQIQQPKKIKTADNQPDLRTPQGTSLRINTPASIPARTTTTGKWEVSAMYKDQLPYSLVDASGREAAQPAGPPTTHRPDGTGQRFLDCYVCDLRQELAERRRPFAVRAARELCTPLAALRLQLGQGMTYCDHSAALTAVLHSTEHLQNAVIDLLLSARLDAPSRNGEEITDLNPSGSS